MIQKRYQLSYFLQQLDFFIYFSQGLATSQQLYTRVADPRQVECRLKLRSF